MSYRPAESFILLHLIPATALILVGCADLPKRTWSEPTSAIRQVPDGEVSRGAAPRDEAPVANSLPDNLYRLPARPGSETLFRPGFARGDVASACDGPSRFGADADQGLNLFGKTGDELPGADDPPAFGDSGSPMAECAEPPPICFWDDFKGIPRMLWDDNCALYNWPNAIVLGAGAGAAIAMRDNWDKRVRYETAEHRLRWGEGSEVLRQFGEFSYQLPVLFGVYGVSLWCEDDQLHEFSKAALSAYGLSAMYTVAIKGITNTQRPTTEFQDGHYGFPSYHTSSTFCIAAVIDEYYGCWAGIPAYVLAGLVGWSRIDQREHDLSDVVFGSILGFVIGKTVARAHLERYSGFRVTPTYDPASGTTGVTVDTRF
jgi:hypothetical protein